MELDDSDYVQSFESTKNAVSLAGTDECQDIVNKLCGKQMNELERLLLNGASPKELVKGARDLISCLIDHQKEIGDKCDDMKFITSVDPMVTSSASKQTSLCGRELYYTCGETLEELERAIQSDDILKISQLALIASSCITERMDSIEPACAENNADDDDELENESIAAVSTMSMMNMMGIETKESRCHKGLYDMCGDEMSALKKGIQHTSPNGIVGGALEVAGCITINFVRLVKACSPFEKSVQKNEMMMMGSTEMKTMEKESPVNPKDIHFDFSQCVEMAKKMLIEDYQSHHSHHGHHPPPHHHDWDHHHHHDSDHHHHHEWDHHHHCWDHHHHHHPLGLLLHLVGAILMGAAFVKGYKYATGRSICFWKSKCPFEKPSSPNAAEESSNETKNEAPLLKEVQTSNIA